jgi:hypothetical protein
MMRCWPLARRSRSLAPPHLIRKSFMLSPERISVGRHADEQPSHGLSATYFADEPGRRSAANLHDTSDEAGRLGVDTSCEGVK